MKSPHDTTGLQDLLDQPAPSADANEKLIAHAWQRLLVLTRKMLHHYPRLRRWEQTEDVFQTAALKLYQAMRDVRPKTTAEFFGLAALQIRRTLIDLARHHFGPEGDSSRDRDGYGGLHGAGTGRGYTRRRRSQRHLQSGVHHVFSADRPTRNFEHDPHGQNGGASGIAGAVTRGTTERHARVPGGHLREDGRQEAGRTSAIDDRIARGIAGVRRTDRVDSRRRRSVASSRARFA